MSDEFGMSLNDFHTERVSSTHNVAAFRRQRVEIPEHLHANIIVAMINLRKAMQSDAQPDVVRYVLNALRALEKELVK